MYVIISILAYLYIVLTYINGYDILATNITVTFKCVANKNYYCTSTQLTPVGYTHVSICGGENM